MSSAQAGRRGFLAGIGSLASLGSPGPPRGPGDDHGSGSFLSPGQRADIAVITFESGFHCAQSVLEVYADDHGLDPLLARRMAAALAGGSTVGGECGAVAAGYLVLGMRHGRTEPMFGDVDQEEELFGRLRRFAAGFRERQGPHLPGASGGRRLHPRGAGGRASEGPVPDPLPATRPRRRRSARDAGLSRRLAALTEYRDRNASVNRLARRFVRSLSA